jgi:hypothetical protein
MVMAAAQLQVPAPTATTSTATTPTANHIDLPLLVGASTAELTAGANAVANLPLTLLTARNFGAYSTRGSGYNSSSTHGESKSSGRGTPSGERDRVGAVVLRSAPRTDPSSPICHGDSDVDSELSDSDSDALSDDDDVVTDLGTPKKSGVGGGGGGGAAGPLRLMLAAAASTGTTTGFVLDPHSPLPTIRDCQSPVHLTMLDGVITARPISSSSSSSSSNSKPSSSRTGSSQQLSDKEKAQGGLESPSKHASFGGGAGSSKSGSVTSMGTSRAGDSVVCGTHPFVWSVVLCPSLYW